MEREQRRHQLHLDHLSTTAQNKMDKKRDNDDKSTIVMRDEAYNCQ